MSIITQDDLDKIAEITRLHDEAFAHLQQYDKHAKSSDGYVALDVSFGTVWERNTAKETGEIQAPRVSVTIYSYVVASDLPGAPNIGDRQHWFETVDEALTAVTAWHKAALEYQPTEEDLKKLDDFAQMVLDAIGDKLTVIEAGEEAEDGKN